MNSRTMYSEKKLNQQSQQQHDFDPEMDLNGGWIDFELSASASSGAFANNSPDVTFQSEMDENYSTGDWAALFQAREPATNGLGASEPLLFDSSDVLTAENMAAYSLGLPDAQFLGQAEGDVLYEDISFNDMGFGSSGESVSDAFGSDLFAWDDQYLSSLEQPSPLDTTTTSPDCSTGSTSDISPFQCTVNGCFKFFKKESQLHQHQRVHRKTLICPICRKEKQKDHKFAQVRDLERHLQARHREVAARANVRSEERECPTAGCDYRGRRDNVSRHHESKHGRKLKWKRGIPYIVS